MNRPDKDLRSIKNLFFVILLVIAGFMAFMIWYILNDTPAQIYNNNYVSQKPASAYDLAVKRGFQGTEEQWLASLKGEPGENGKDGKDGKTKVIHETKDGAPGKSAYQIWLDEGNTGSPEDFLLSLSPPQTQTKFLQIRFNIPKNQYESKYSTDTFWKAIPTCGVITPC